MCCVCKQRSTYPLEAPAIRAVETALSRHQMWFCVVLGPTETALVRPLGERRAAGAAGGVSRPADRAGDRQGGSRRRRGHRPSRQRAGTAAPGPAGVLIEGCDRGVRHVRGQPRLLCLSTAFSLLKTVPFLAVLLRYADCIAKLGDAIAILQGAAVHDPSNMVLNARVKEVEQELAAAVNQKAQIRTELVANFPSVAGRHSPEDPKCNQCRPTVYPLRFTHRRTQSAISAVHRLSPAFH